MRNPRLERESVTSKILERGLGEKWENEYNGLDYTYFKKCEKKSKNWEHGSVTPKTNFRTIPRGD